MLSDLKQYFTSVKEISLKNLKDTCDFVYLMANLVPLIQDDITYIRMCEDISYAVDEMDTFFLNYIDVTTVTEHWGDQFECLNGRGNELMLLILLTCCRKEDIAMDSYWDNFYDYSKHTNCVFNRYVDGYARSWFRSELNDEDIDEDIEECSSFQIFYEVLEFKNKSIGRKIKKEYNSNAAVRSLFIEMGYHIVNGRLTSIGWYDMESYDPLYGCYDVGNIIDGVKALRKALNLKKIKRDERELAMNLHQLDNRAIEEQSRIPYYIETIMSIYHTDKEIIL